MGVGKSQLRTMDREFPPMNVRTYSNASTGSSVADARPGTASGLVWWPRSLGSMEQASTWKIPRPVSRSGCVSRAICDRSDQIGSNKNHGRKEQPGFLAEPRLLAHARTRLVELHPAVTAPVAATLMFAPPEAVAGTPSPIVGMDGHASVGRILVDGTGVPAH